MTRLTAAANVEAASAASPSARAHRILVVATHVIQYQDPFFRLLASEPDVDLLVAFCSRLGASEYHDVDMGVRLSWDLDVLSGYRHVFAPNWSPWPESLGFWRVVNPGLAGAIVRERPDAVLLMAGWGVASSWIAIATCVARGIPFLLYGDSCRPPPVVGIRDWLRARVMRWLCARASGFMVTGRFNADYYLHYGGDAGRFFDLPWAIDNERFEQGSALAAGEREALRAKHGIEPDQVTVVFSGKLIERKDPLVLLRAATRMRHRDRMTVLYVGDGALRSELEVFAHEHGLGNTRFAGFVNQAALPKLYAIADIFALPSWDDPRATVVNEAMACGLPILLTDRCGPVGDIATDGDNAIVVPPGDVDAIARALDRLVDDADLRRRMGARSREIIASWNYAAGVEGTKRALARMKQVSTA